MTTVSNGGSQSIDELIVQAATGARTLTADDLQGIVDHIAQAGFDPAARERVRGRLAGIVWRGAVLRGADRLPPAEVKYIWHVLVRQEWPGGTSLAEYVASIAAVIHDRASGVFTSRYQAAWQVGIVRASKELQGPGGSPWVLIEYRLETGHWMTAYQPRRAIEDELSHPRRDRLRWLRSPESASR